MCAFMCVLKCSTRKNFKIFQKWPNLDKKNSKILSDNFFCKIRKIWLQILCIVPNFHANRMRNEDSLLLATFKACLRLKSYVTASCGTLFSVSLSNFATTLPHKLHYFDIRHILEQTHFGIKLKLTIFASKNV